MTTKAPYFKSIFQVLWTVFVGMRITMRHLFVKKVTRQYPAERYTLPERARNRLYVNMDDCIGCDQCARACPVDCIVIETAKSMPGEDLGVTSAGKKKALWVTKFDIDIAKCCYCSLCVWPCPTECIKMTDVYEFSEFDRGNLIYRFATMTPAETEAATSKLAAFDREQAAKKAAAAAAPKPAPASAPAPPQPVPPAAGVPPNTETKGE